MTFKDHFSRQAQRYAAARPRYPVALYEWLFAQVEALEHAWDAATGNGQVALALAERFARVTATDASAAQLRHAFPRANVSYRNEPAEAPSLADASVDLVTVGQALHWFDRPRFFEAARRVMKPGAVIAAWTYNLSHVTPAVDAVYRGVYYDALAGDWPPERALVEDSYRGIELPFTPIEGAPSLALSASWSCDEYLAYFETWSATQRHRDRTGVDPIAPIVPAMRAAWGDVERRVVTWPLTLLVGRR